MKINQTKTYKSLKDAKKDNSPQMIIVHHTGGTDADIFADTSHHTAEIIEAWHYKRFTNSRGIGYHYIIEKDGKVSAGRPEHVSGAHCVGYNSKSLGICIVGNFDATSPTKEQEQAFIELYRDITKRNGELEVKEHRDFANKTCPGRNIEKDTFAKIAKNAIEPKRELLDSEPEAIKLAEKELEQPDAVKESFDSIFKQYDISEYKSESNLPITQKIFEWFVYSSSNANRIGATAKGVGALLTTYFINPLSEVIPGIANINVVSGIQTTLFYFGIGYAVFGILRKAYYEIKSTIDKNKDNLSILQ